MRSFWHCIRGIGVADIFISYSKADRDKVVMLAAYLEAEGWTTWWDTNLAVGTQYRMRTSGMAISHFLSGRCTPRI
jgi:hypothetical protein